MAGDAAERVSKMLETPKNTPPAPAVSPSQIAAAIEALTPPELLRLRAYSRYRMRAMGGVGLGKTHEDLLSEALMMTLSGARRWNHGAVDMVGHLCGVMRSMSSHWVAQIKADGEVASDELARSAPASAPSPERQLLAQDEVQRIRAHFADDAAVSEVLDAFAAGLSGVDVKRTMSLTQTGFETIMKRLRRGVARMERDGHEQ